MYGVYQALPTVFGEVLVAEINKELCAISFTTTKNKLDAIKDLAKLYPSVDFVHGEVANGKNILRLLSGHVVEGIPISSLVYDRCSDFRRDVYRELLRIPRGSTKTYSELASLMNRPRAYRAVAQACAANVLAVVVPCHRVVASDGSLGGYKWGVTIKRGLLNIEKSSALTQS